MSWYARPDRSVYVKKATVCDPRARHCWGVRAARAVSVCALALAVWLLLPRAAAAPGTTSDMTCVASGQMAQDYYTIDNNGSVGTPVPGNALTVWDGENYFMAYMTAQRRLLGCYIAPDGTPGSTLILGDYSQSAVQLSQPSACSRGGEIYVSWVVGDGSSNKTGYLLMCRIRDGAASEPVELCHQKVYTRRASLAADESGVMVVYRVISDSACSEIHGLYVTTGDTLQAGTPFVINDADHNSGNYYPSMAYAAETGNFLVVWQHANSATVTGALLRKDTAATPENFRILYANDGYLEQSRVASDGSGFCVSAHRSGNGIYTNLVASDGTVTGSGVRAVTGAVTNGTLAYDGTRYIMSYSRESTAKMPDFRYEDGYLAYIDPSAGVVDSARTIGIATGWWHQFHLQCTVGGDGSLFCGYLENRGAEVPVTMHWVLLQGEIPAASPTDLATPLSLQAGEYHSDVYGGSALGDTAFALYDGAVQRYTPATGWQTLSGAYYYTDMFDSCILDDSRFYAAGWNGQSLWLNSVDGGYTFNSWGSCTENDVNYPGLAVYAADGAHIYTCTSDGKIFLRADGEPWQEKVYQSAAGADLRAIAGSGTDAVCAAGDRGSIVWYDGASWTDIASPVITSLNGAWMDSTGAVWLVGDGGHILRVKAGVCTEVPSPVSTNLYDIWGAFDDMIFACGADGTVLLYDGTAWRAMAPADDAPLFTDVFGLVDHDSCTLYVTAPNACVFYHADVPLSASHQTAPPEDPPSGDPAYDHGSILATDSSLVDSAAVTVSADLAGADVYIDGTLAGVTPLENYAVSAGSHTVSVELPGYVTLSCQAQGGQKITAALRPELYPAAYEGKVTCLTVDNSALTLADALTQAMDDTGENWYLIRFADGITEAYTAKLEINRRGRLTIDGGAGVALSGGGFNIYASDVRLVGIEIEGSGFRQQNALQLRTPDDRDIVYNIKNVYVLGCTFTNCFEIGVATCGAYGYAGTAYGGPGTTNVSNLVFSGNTFNSTCLFSFAGAGDEDYNVIDGYSICANTFTDCGIGMLAGDAHTWYVFGADSAAGGFDGSERHIAYCEHNVLRNVLVSGNSVTMTADGQRTYEGIMGVSCANLGNSNNLVEYVEFRHNTSRITGGDKNMHSSVNISNVSVSDSYEEGKGYNQYVTPGMEHTDNNTLRHVYVHDNDFQLGSEREMQVRNIDVNVGRQCGAGNTMSGIRIEGNAIEAACGVRINNYAGNSHSGTCENNTLTGVTFSDNTLTRKSATYYDVGVLVSGSYISQHGEDTDAMPVYRGSMTDITVSGNTVDGYIYGIVAAGAAGDYGQGQTVSGVAVTDNTIVNRNFNTWPAVDVGVTVAGAALQGNWESADKSPRANQSCTIRDVTVTGNRVTALTGVAVTGLLATERVNYPATGNRAEDVTVTGNTLTRRDTSAEQNAQTTGGVVTGDVVEIWYKLGFTGGDTVAMAGGSTAERITVSTNVCTGFRDDLLLYHDTLRTDYDPSWQWLSDGENIMAKAPVNDLWVYANFDTDGVRLTQNGTQLQADCSLRAGHRLLVGLYSRDGQLLAVREILPGSTQTLTIPLTAAAESAEAMIVDGSYAPVQASAAQPLGAA